MWCYWFLDLKNKTVKDIAGTIGKIQYDYGLCMRSVLLGILWKGSSLE